MNQMSDTLQSKKVTTKLYGKKATRGRKALRYTTIIPPYVGDDSLYEYVLIVQLVVVIFSHTILEY